MVSECQRVLRSDLEANLERTRQYIVKNPGLSRRELADRLHIGFSTVEYHVDLLRGRGLVRVVPGENKRGNVVAKLCPAVSS